MAGEGVGPTGAAEATSPPRRPQLHMRRALVDLPEPELPDEYALRSFRPDDAEAWRDLLVRNGELGEWSEARAAPYFAPASRVVLEASYFVEHEGRPVATAQLNLESARPDALTRESMVGTGHGRDALIPAISQREKEIDMPELGWVAVDPGHRGRRLGRAVCLAVMRAAAARGHRAIYLKTDDHRLPAIRTYGALGFEPWMLEPSAPARWRAVRTSLRS